MIKRHYRLSASALCLGALLSLTPNPAPAQTAQTQCEVIPSESQSSASWLDRSSEAIGMPGVGSRVLRLDALHANYLREQSDRTYAPFILISRSSERWFDRATGREWFGPRNAPRAAVMDGAATYAVVGVAVTFNPALDLHQFETRGFNPWAVIADWTARSDVRVVERCSYREYPRIVLHSRGRWGPEKLFLDEKTAFPVKLERLQPHYLWGDALTEFIYATWWSIAPGIHFPVSVTQLQQGIVAGSQTVMPGKAALIVPDSAPQLRELVLDSIVSPLNMREFGGSSTVPDTIRVGANSFLLRTPQYTHAVTLVGDTVFLMDATTGEARARADSAWIARLFPRHKHVALLVTDLAWPHIAGVRFWVASGATIISHKHSRDFLQRVINQRWQSPDKLERTRSSSEFRFRPVDGALSLAAGAITVVPIDGVASESAIMAFFREDRFLWPGDFIQDAAAPSLYAADVWHAAQRYGLRPVQVAAQHLPLTAWQIIDELIRTIHAATPTDT